MHLEEKTVNSESIYKGRIFEVTKDTALLENGKEVLRDVVHHSGGVTVIPITDNNEILMVRQYRYPHHKAILEIPAAKSNPAKNIMTAEKENFWKKQAVPANHMNIWGRYFLLPPM